MKSIDLHFLMVDQFLFELLLYHEIENLLYLNHDAI